LTPKPPAKGTIRERALALGFDAVGFAAPEAVAAARRRLTEFLARGWHGDMAWMATTAARRGDPRALWPGVRSVVVLGLNYGPPTDPLAPLDEPGRGAVSCYARGRDYHRVIGKRLKALGRWLTEAHGAEVKSFVDTAPVLEKPLAQAAGLGWQGKHTNLVSRGFGSWLFLGELFTSLELAADKAEGDLDARRCISYLTIEHKGHIAPEFRAAIGNRVFGCDDCLAVCPWNKFARASAEAAFQPRAELDSSRLAEFAALNDAAFRRRFSGSPVKRLGRDRFLRNVLIAIANSGDERLAAAAEGLLADPSPLVRAMAVWALARLVGEGRFADLRRQHLGGESDPEVRQEWTRG
jgi:epoxyqueuosine reductase